MSKLESNQEINKFKNHIEFIRSYFKDGDCVSFMNPEYIHENGISREEAELMYAKEIQKRKKYSSLPNRIKDFISGNMRQVLDNNYKTILDLMDKLQKDFIDEKDLCLPYMKEQAESLSNQIIKFSPNGIVTISKDNILLDVESFYNQYYQSREGEELEK